MTDRTVIKDKTRDKIIEAASEVFAQKGFHATKMEDIARIAHIAKGTIYLYFPTKKELFSSLFEHSLNLVERKVNEVTRNGGNPILALENVLEALLDVVREKREFFRLIMQNFFLDLELQISFKQWREKMIDAVASRIDAPHRALAKIKASIIFYFLLSVFLSFLSGDLSPDPETIKEIKSNYSVLIRSEVR